MRLAILVTNTDESEFSDRHPKDGEKFTALIKGVRPDWVCDVYHVKDGVFPDRIDCFDGHIITGSPASVHDGDHWIDRLHSLIVDAHDRKLPMFGACFGHQAIAKALGGKVEDNPDGWVLGTVEVSSTPTATENYQIPSTVYLYAAHREQVTRLPDSGQVICSSPGCPIAGFVMSSHIYTTQYHPEMTPGFIAALTEELSSKLPKDVIEKARLSLQRQADTDVYAETIALFFEKTGL